MALNPSTSSTRPVSASGRLTSVPDPQIEILCNVDGARIISFSIPSNSSSRPSSSNGPAEEDTDIGSSLRWSSSAERTIAVGTLRIYRAPESVAFVNCQKALKPILPRSQCWFVSDDGSSKFVLQVRKLQEYWRIEIRNTTSEEIKQVEEFKKILAQSWWSLPTKNRGGQYKDRHLGYLYPGVIFIQLLQGRHR
ncbi:hypothetical protein EYC80_007472 [Monilinia laxa]|uniref:Inheritance of peroxisomes protein 1 n=1 Tax=Monilinia laxa TaxID=61186 RepID=A0A5N6JW07_MONLA|nr:hypothetical protein EYC80_007472 [Monilinia laxa]